MKIHLYGWSYSRTSRFRTCLCRSLPLHYNYLFSPLFLFPVVLPPCSLLPVTRPVIVGSTRPVFVTNRVGWNFGGRSLQTHKALAHVINAQQTPSRKERAWSGAGPGERGGAGRLAPRWLTCLSSFPLLFWKSFFSWQTMGRMDMCVCDMCVYVTLELLCCPRLLRGVSASDSLRQGILGFQMFCVEGVHRLDRLRPLFVVQTLQSILLLSEMDSICHRSTWAICKIWGWKQDKARKRDYTI